MQQKKDILIIGGGVIGMALAYELSNRGAKVTVIDKGEIGYGCSYGNAGWITPCFAMPLPMPGMLLKSIGWLMDPESPLYIKPSADPLLMRWLFRFLRSMNRPLMLQSIKALTEVSKYSLDSYRDLNDKFPGVIGYEQKGLLMVSQTDAGISAAIDEMKLVAPHGIPGQLLDEAAVRQLEPALTGPLKGGVYFPAEAHAEPLAVVKALTEGAVKNGAQILPGTEVYDFEIENRKITGIRTTRGTLRADQYVLATGVWSTAIANALGLTIPVMGGKGYSWILKPFSPAPKIPMMLVERKIAVTPRNGTIRLAGTLELVGAQDQSITTRRADAILRGARLFMNVPEKPEVVELWRGLRPCTPDGVPVIGYPSRYENLLVSTGHQMLGLQSAPGCARLGADLLLGATPAFDPYPFRADRF